jgi:hypothetical protein
MGPAVAADGQEKHERRGDGDGDASDGPPGARHWLSAPPRQPSGADGWLP